MLSIACDKARFLNKLLPKPWLCWPFQFYFYEVVNIKFICVRIRSWLGILWFFFYSSVVVIVTRCCCDFCCWYWIFFVLGQNECMSNYCLVPYHRYAIIKHGHNTQSQLKCNKAELRLLHRQPDHIVELWLRLLYASWCLLGIRECLVEYGAW